MARDRHLDLARLGELDRVRKKVQDDLTEPARVSQEHLRQLLVDLVDKLDPLTGNDRRHHVESTLDRSASVASPACTRSINRSVIMRPPARRHAV